MLTVVGSRSGSSGLTRLGDDRKVRWRLTAHELLLVVDVSHCKKHQAPQNVSVQDTRVNGEEREKCSL